MQSKPPSVNTVKMCFSSKLYYLKVDEINQPVFFNNERAMDLTSIAKSTEKPSFSETMIHDVILNCLDSSSIRKAKAKLQKCDNLTDNLGNNSKIENYFE